MDIGSVEGRTQDGATVRSISPTDVSQFIRLDQCRRYLRLQLYRRNGNANFMKEYGVVPQSIPQILTRSGKDFELRVEGAVNGRYVSVDLSEDRTGKSHDANDNEFVVRRARDLPSNDVDILFQPRLRVTIDGWRVSGDIDILRLERDTSGELHLLIVDMKSSTAARVEHRLQVAFYLEMVTALLAEAGVSHQPIEIGILYRGPGADGLEDGERTADEMAAQRTAAYRLFNVDDAYLEIVADPGSYREAVRDLVTGDGSVAAEIAETPFVAVPFHLTYKCDGCVFNEYCMKWAAEHDDLSVVPHLTGEDKSALQAAGIETVRELAALKELAPKDDSAPTYAGALRTVPGHEATVRELARSWPVGPRLDELIVRARSYRRSKGDAIDSLSYIPSRGYGSLPYADAEHNPNLVRVYMDAQHDFLNDRIYLLGALVMGLEGGQPVPERRRSIVRVAEEPPARPDIEQDLFVRWITDVMRAIREVAAPDAAGEHRAPIHLIFFNRYEQDVLLAGLARHLTTIMGATPLYDFATQIAGFDSPVVTFLDAEIRELKNYPMLCQSLQAVSAYLKFEWGDYRDIYRTRVFDFWQKFDDPPRDGESPWYLGRARFNSQIPLEYAYAAWHDLPAPSVGKHDEFASYREATRENLLGFHTRRLEALEHIAADFTGNRQTQKTSFSIPDLDRFEQRADSLAAALDDFLTVERHIELGGWKTARLAPPERRVLSGITLLARYREDDQSKEVAEANRENARRQRLRAELEASAGPAGLSKEQKVETAWSQEDLEISLDLVCERTDCSLDEVLTLSRLKQGSWVVVMPRTDVDSRLPVARQRAYTPTPKQMLYGTRAEIVQIDAERDASRRVMRARVRLKMGRGARSGERGYVFGNFPQPFEDGHLYTVDADPNNHHGQSQAKVTTGLRAGKTNTLYARLTSSSGAAVTWPEDAAHGQAQFLEGLDALHAVGAMQPFEQSKRDYIARNGDASVLLVQGPPGTGKTYSTAYALLARLQGALAAGMPFRVVLSCRTHAATDVLLTKLAEARDHLRAVRERYPAIFDRYFDVRILDVPLFRMGRPAPRPDIGRLYKQYERPKGEPRARDAIAAEAYCVVGAVPGGVLSMLSEVKGDLFGHAFVDCLILDEASQMNIPEAIMAALPLTETGQLIVVGDHRQMAPIVKNDWAADQRRTFKEFRAYESLFLALLPLQPPMIKFEESFRLHRDMAEFLRAEIYVHDGINFHSKQHRELPPMPHDDPFVAAVLDPNHAIVVVVHDEAGSMLRNPSEQALATPLLEALAGEPYNLDARHGLGVVVPHTAQRAALLDAIPQLTTIDPESGAVAVTAVDTVERYQGDEREAMVFSATESDPQYLLVSSSFLLDPRRLNVALSRSRAKMVLVASRSIFSLFCTDEETFANAQLWKNLLRKTCTVLLWEGDRAGTHVEVWGNHAASPADGPAAHESRVPVTPGEPRVQE